MEGQRDAGTREKIYQPRVWDVPLLVPELPTLDVLIPYLRRIDENRWYSNFGPLTRELEARLAATFEENDGVQPHAVTVSNGTAGIELALRALELPPSSAVLVPALTFVATATAVYSAGLTPIVADVDPESWLLTAEIATAALDHLHLQAIVPVATMGCPQDAAAWDEFYVRTGVPVVIDAAAGFGNQTDPGPTCTVFSLHATKPLAAGEGGFVVTRSRALAEAIRQLSNFGINLIDPTAGPIGTATKVGTNAKLSEYHAAVGLASLDQWPRNAAHRRALHRDYHADIAALSALSTKWQAMADSCVRSVCCFLLESEEVRNRAEAALESAGIGHRRWYLPAVNKHSAFERIAHMPTPNADALAKRLLGIPFYPGLEAATRSAILETLSKAA